MFTLNCNGRLLVLDKPLVMGIINVTPDSFYGGSRVNATEDVILKAGQMIHDGAAIIDIGGQSTRPGSSRLTAEEEANRVIPVITALHAQFPEAVISIDTFYARVAEAAVHAGAGMVNDISGGSFDTGMMETVGRLGVPYVCMHVKGTPDTMHQQPEYNNVLLEVLDYFIKKTDECKKAGISDVIIDPGFGFAKTIAHNFQLMSNLQAFSIFEMPVLAGISRKSTIYKTLGITAEEALNGTTALNTICLLNGANILRVHDVREAVEAVKLVGAYLGNS